MYRWFFWCSINSSSTFQKPEGKTQQSKAMFWLLFQCFTLHIKCAMPLFSTHTLNIKTFCPPVWLRFRPLSYRNSIWFDRSFHCMVYLWICIMFADFWALLNIHFVAIARYRQYRWHREKSQIFRLFAHIHSQWSLWEMSES